jgi:hypothetical protein
MTDSEFIEANRRFVEIYSKELIVEHMNRRTMERLYSIVQKIDPGYRTDLWCEPCIRAFVINAYQIYDASKH